MPKIEITPPGGKSVTKELKNDLIFGRAAPANVVVPDPKMSRRHCKIARSATGWQLEDLGSSNGTRVGGRVVKSHPLQDGDKIEVGQTAIVFHGPEQKKYAAPVRSSSARERMRQKKRR